MTTKVKLKAVSASKEHTTRCTFRKFQRGKCMFASHCLTHRGWGNPLRKWAYLKFSGRIFFFITMKLETLWRNKLKVHLVKEVGATCNLPFSCDAAWKSSVTWKITAKLQARSKFRLCMRATSSISNHESSKKNACALSHEWPNANWI